MKTATATRIFVGLSYGIFMMATATAAQAIDLTGTWIGKYSCKEFVGVKESFKVTESTLEISPDGDNFSVNLDDDFFYSAMVIPDDKNPDKKAEAAFVSCENDSVPGVGESEIFRAMLSAKPGTIDAKIKAKSIYEGPSYVGECKYSFKRISDVDPLVPPCS